MMIQAEKETRDYNTAESDSLKLKQTSSKGQDSQPVPVTKQAVVTKIKQKPSKKRANIIKLTDSVAKLAKKKSKSKEESK